MSPNCLDEALHRLAKIDPQQSRVVELRFFSGLNVEETAEGAGSFSGNREARLERSESLATSGTKRRPE